MPEKVNWREIGVSASSLGDWLECNQKARLRKQGWMPRRTPFPLNYGRIAHEVLEAVHNFVKAQQPFDAEKVVAAVCDRIQKSEAGKWDSVAEQDFELIKAQLTAVIPAYVKYYEKKDAKRKLKEIEGKFRVPFEGTYLNGYFDLVYEEKGGLWPSDTKNVGDIREEELGEVLLRDLQINIYLLALSILTGKLPAGFIYNMIRRPGLKLGKSETIQAYVKRIREHISEKGEEYYFQRYRVHVVKEELEQFKAWLKAKLPEYFAWCDASMPGELYGQPCRGRYGLCVYVPLCYNDDYSRYEKINFKGRGKG
jgi:hypothetical protein